MNKKKLLKKALGILTISAFLIGISNINVAKALANNNIYEKHYQVDLKDFDITLENDVVNVKANKVSLLSKLSKYQNEKTFKKMLTNKSFEKNLKKSIKEGRTPIAIGVAEAEIVKTYDEEGNLISSRPMTNKEVTEEKFTNKVFAAVNGQTQTRENLSLFTSVSGSSPDYWIQSNAYWGGNGEYSSGNECIGLTWDSSVHANNSSSTNMVYTLEANKKGSLQSFKENQGAAWSFRDGAIVNGGLTSFLTGAYAGISVTTPSTPATHYINSEYIHTFQSLSWTAEVTYDSNNDSTKATIKLNPTPNSWKLVSYLKYTL